MGHEVAGPATFQLRGLQVPATYGCQGASRHGACHVIYPFEMAPHMVHAARGTCMIPSQAEASRVSLCLQWRIFMDDGRAALLGYCFSELLPRAS